MSKDKNLVNVPTDGIEKSKAKKDPEHDETSGLKSDVTRQSSNTVYLKKSSEFDEEKNKFQLTKEESKTTKANKNKNKIKDMRDTYKMMPNIYARVLSNSNLPFCDVEFTYMKEFVIIMDAINEGVIDLYLLNLLSKKGKDWISKKLKDKSTISISDIKELSDYFISISDSTIDLFNNIAKILEVYILVINYKSEDEKINYKPYGIYKGLNTSIIILKSRQKIILMYTGELNDKLMKLNS